jgi:tRNA(adenine34) deaminase
MSEPLPQGVTSVDEAMMHRAIALARRAAEVEEVPVGAVVYLTAEQRIVGEGYNLRHLTKDPTAHAELLAIREAAFVLGDWRLTNCTLVVTLEPCAMCAGLIVNARLGRVVYGCTDPKAGAVDTLYTLTRDQRLNHRVEPIGGLLAGECAEVLQTFFRRTREAKESMGQRARM